MCFKDSWPRAAMLSVLVLLVLLAGCSLWLHWASKERPPSLAFQHEVRCEIRLENLADALQLYAVAHGGQLPAHVGWVQAVRPYLDLRESNPATAFQCPADPHRATRPSYELVGAVSSMPLRTILARPGTVGVEEVGRFHSAGVNAIVVRAGGLVVEALSK